MPRQRVDVGTVDRRRASLSVDAVLYQLRRLGELGDPNSDGYTQLRPTALRAFMRLLKHDTRRSEAQALSMFEVYRLRPVLIPGAPPGATPLHARRHRRVS